LVGILEEGAAAKGKSSRNAAAGSKAMIRALLVCVGLVLAAESAVAQAPAAPEPAPGPQVAIVPD